MSLTATLLLGHPITLPAGKRRTHTMERTSWTGATRQREEHASKQEETRTGNVERVYWVIEAGGKEMTILDIVDASLLSISTVKKALTELETDPNGARIVRIKGKQHRFLVG
jgi:hypothetical protein